MKNKYRDYKLRWLYARYIAIQFAIEQTKHYPVDKPKQRAAKARAFEYLAIAEYERARKTLW